MIGEISQEAINRFLNYGTCDTVEKDSMTLPRRKEDGYINATALCKSAGKEWKHYFENKNTKEFLQELSEQTGIPVNTNAYDSTGIPTASLVQINTGLRVKRVDQATWVHPKVAINLGQWLSPKFAVFVVDVVFDFMTKEMQPKQKNFSNYISSLYVPYPPFNRQWQSLMLRFFKTTNTPKHIESMVYNNAFGHGADFYIETNKTGNRKSYHYLTDQGREVLDTYLKAFLQTVENIDGRRAFENALATFVLNTGMLSNNSFLSDPVHG